jgi:sugar phosphate isomerase/epimerase
MFKNLCPEALGITGTQSELIELALSHGFRGVDLDIVAFQRQVDARGLPASRRLLDSAKLKQGRFQLPFELDAEEAAFADGLKQLEGQAKLASELGCTRVVTRLAPASDQLPYHQNFEQQRKRIAQVADVLAPHGLRLGVGFRAAPAWREGKAFQFISQLEPLVMLLGLAGKRNVGLALDLWDVYVSGGSADDVRKVSPEQVVTVELADFPADADRTKAGEKDRLLPGESGQIDAAAMLTWLAERGYDGPVTPVPDRGWFAGQRREEIGRRVGQSLEGVWKAAGLSPHGKLLAAGRK